MATSPITAWQIEGEKVETVIDFLFSGFKITVDSDCSHEFRRQLLLGRKAMTNRDSVLKSRDITLPTKVFSQGSGLPSGHVQLWELDCKKSRMPKNWCLQTSIVVLKKTPESPLDSKEIEPVNLKGDQLSILTGRTDAKAEAPVLWPPDVKSQLIWKDPDAGKDWGEEENRATEDEMVN